MTDIDDLTKECEERKRLLGEKRERDGRRRALIHHLVDCPDDPLPEEFKDDPKVTRIKRSLGEPERTEPTRRESNPAPNPRPTPTPPPTPEVWNETRLTAEATRLFRDGKTDAEVAAALKPHNPDITVCMKAQAAGKAAK